ncbi:MAG: GFA family protein [Alphaproteobacteria bacterium]|nr:MAG: GFA family protein [Alphaproteobacteria bacterium]
MKLSGGCHCGTVRFSAEVDTDQTLLDCNCSICSQTGFLHVIVPHKDFVLEQGDGDLTSYRFGTGQAEHLFCRHCGIKSFYQPRSHPDCWSVNFHCLDQGHGWTPQIVTFDGRNWEQAAAQIP